MAIPQGHQSGGGIQGPAGPSIFSFVPVSGIYNTDPNDFIIGVDTSTISSTINLVSAGLMPLGGQIYIKDESGNASINNITINANVGEFIDGIISLVIMNDYSVIRLYSNGSDWFSF